MNSEEEQLPEQDNNDTTITSSISPPCEIEEAEVENEDQGSVLEEYEDLNIQVAQNSKASSSGSPPSEIETARDDISYLSNFVEESSSPFSSNGVVAKCFGAVSNIVLSRTNAGKAFLKWLFLALNVAIEVYQATVAQEAAQGKMGCQNYLKLSIITSSLCLLMSLVEAVHEGRTSGAVWQRRGYCCWFYAQGRPFGKFFLYFGIISSMIQLFVNLTAKYMNKDFTKLDYLPLLLAMGQLVAAIFAAREQARLSAIVECKTHGYNAAEAMIVDGLSNQVFACPQCQMEDLI